MENKQLIGRNIKNIRAQLGMKQKELANSLDISYGYLSEVESGKKSPGLEVVGNLLQKYEVNPTYLLTGEGDYFLTTGKGKPGKRRGKAKEGDVYNDAIDEMIWYIDHIPAVGFAVLGFFKQYLYEKKDMIDSKITRGREKNSGEAIH